MSALVSHSTGNPFLRAVLRALEGDEVLSEFCTAVSLSKALPPLSGYLSPLLS